MDSHQSRRAPYRLLGLLVFVCVSSTSLNAQERDGYFWKMSDSTFLMKLKGVGRFSLIYFHVRESLEREGVRRGDLSFEGTVGGGQVTGVGYLYSGRCRQKVSYEASGSFSSDYSKLMVSGNANLLDSNCRPSGSTTVIRASYESMMPPGEIAAVLGAAAASTRGPLKEILTIGAQHSMAGYLSGLSERDRLSLSRAKDLAIATGREIAWVSNDGASRMKVQAEGGEFIRNGRTCRVIQKSDVIMDDKRMPSYKNVECLFGVEWKEI